MEQIQFLTYILSILSVLLSGVALWVAFKVEEKIDKSIQDLQSQVNTVRINTNENKNGRR